MKNKVFFLGLFSLAIIYASCTNKDSGVPEPDSFPQTNANGALINGDSSLISMQQNGMDEIFDSVWLDYLGFIPKREPRSHLTLLAYPNPLAHTANINLRIISDNSPITHILSSDNNGVLGLDIGGYPNSFPISTYVNFELEQGGISVDSRYYTFMAVTADSCIYSIFPYIKRI